MTIADLIYRFFAWIYNNKQSLLGSLVAALAFIQASPQLRSLLSPNAYEWTMLGAGLLMVLFARSTGSGVVSHVLPPAVPPLRTPKEGGFVQPLMLAVLLGLASIVVIGPGCTGTQTAYRSVDSVEDQAFVVLEHYAALLKEAADYRDRVAAFPPISAEDRQAVSALQAADAAAQPAIAEVNELLALYRAGSTAQTPEELQRAIDAAIIKVADLLRVVKATRAPK